MNPQAVFCPNWDCSSRGAVSQGNIRVHSYPQRRFRCTTCKKTFAATKGTPLYRLRSDEETLARVKGLTRSTSSASSGAGVLARPSRGAFYARFNVELPTGEKVWLIIEADKSATRLLLPEEYQPA